ncbi:hypothetical protein [Nonomuraea typhae]|uniref:hypothetical protein n=1 Tax=Nonomuraea typhae TaxID=2603600 RepID=UPI0012F958B8|nr:hypothetical protein [Nonomuraea typhae]
MNQDNRDVALLLKKAAEQVEIEAAPYQAVVRGGRRRRARRRAVLAGVALAVVVSGFAGTAAFEDRPIVNWDRANPTAVQRHVYDPQVTALGVVAGRRLFIEVWGAPRDDAELREQKARMIRAGVWEGRAPKGFPPPAVGETWFFVYAPGDSGGKEPVASGVEAPPDGNLGNILVAGLDRRRLAMGMVSPDVVRITGDWSTGSVKGTITQVRGLHNPWFTVEGDASAELKSITSFHRDGTAEHHPL